MATIARSQFITSSNGFGTTHDLNFGTAVSAGNAIIILLHEYHDVTGTPTVNGASGTVIVDYNVDKASGKQSRAYSLPNAPSGATGFRFTTSSSHSNIAGWVVEVNGAATSSMFVAGGSFPSDFGPTELDAVATGASAGDFALAFFSDVPLANITSTRSGFTQSSDSTGTLLLQHNLNTSAGSITAGATLSSSGFSTDGFVVIYNAGSTGYTLTADSGTYNLTGRASNTLYTRIMPAAQGTYSLTGIDALLVKSGSYSFNAEFGSYTLVGANALVDLSMNAAQGSYALTGQAATLTFTPFSNPSVTAEFGSYTLTGRAANTNYGRLLSAEVGVYALTGRQAGLTWSGAPVSTGYSSQKMTFSALTISI